MISQQLAQNYLLYFIMPVWLVAGIADWYCHRLSKIEETSGVKESFYHLVMMGEIGIPVLLGLLCKVNALVLLVMFFGWLTHAITAYLDAKYAVQHRHISTIEHHIHSFLEIIPIMALSMMALMHWDQFLGLLHIGGHVADWSLAWKKPSLPVPYLLVLFLGFIFLETIPYLEEFWRTLNNKPQADVPFTTTPDP